MTLQKYTLTLLFTFNFSCCLFGAALPEPAAARAQQVGYLAMLHKNILQTTPLDKETAKICAEYANSFPCIRPAHTYQSRALSVTCLAPIGQRYLLASDNNSLRVVDMETQKIAAVSSPHSSPIHTVAYLPPFTVATLSTGSTLRIWDIRNGKIIRTVRDRFYPTHLAPFGKTKVVTAEGNQLVFYDLKSSDVDTCACSSTIDSLLAFQENLCIAAGLGDGKIHVCDTVNSLIIKASKAPIISLASFSHDELVSLDGNSNVAIRKLTKNPHLSSKIIHHVQLSSVSRLIACGNEVIGLPNLPERSYEWGSAPEKDPGTLTRIFKVGPTEILCQQEDLPLDRWDVRTNVVCSTGNSFAWLTEQIECDDESRLYVLPRNSALRTFQLDGSAEEKLDPEVQAWLDAKMNKKSWQFWK